MKIYKNEHFMFKPTQLYLYQLPYTKVLQKYKQIEENISTFHNNELFCCLIKDYFTCEDISEIYKFVDSNELKKNEKSVFKNFDSLKLLSDKVCVTNNLYSETKPKKIDTLNLFNRYNVDIHKDSEEHSIGNVFVIKSEDIKGLLCFPEFEMYANIDEKDLLIFDISKYHYVVTNKPMYKTSYRVSLYFDMVKEML